MFTSKLKLTEMFILVNIFSSKKESAPVKPKLPVLKWIFLLVKLNLTWLRWISILVHHSCKKIVGSRFLLFGIFTFLEFYILDCFVLDCFVLDCLVLDVYVVPSRSNGAMKIEKRGWLLHATQASWFHLQKV